VIDGGRGAKPGLFICHDGSSEMRANAIIKAREIMIRHRRLQSADPRKLAASPTKANAFQN